MFKATFNNISVISWQSVLQDVSVYGALRHFQQYFSYIVAVSFTGSFGLWCFMPLSTMFQLYRSNNGTHTYHMFITKINLILGNI